jgi:hypothetical protein
MLEIRANVRMKPSVSPPCANSSRVTPFTGREGRLPIGDFVPVKEFGLRGWRQ